MKTFVLLMASTTMTLILFGQPTAAQVAVPVGGEFQVNTFTTDQQQDPAVALDDDGNFVVLWQSYGSGGSDSSEWSIQGRIYASTGQPFGSQGQVNTYLTGAQVSPAVGVDADGDFVVVWKSVGSGGDDDEGSSIQGQLYNSTGLPFGGQFQVNTYTTGNQGYPAVGVDSTGDFVVVWDSLGSGSTDDSLLSVQGRAYSSVGVPIGSQFQVNTYTTGIQGSPAVGVDSDGGFVVVWESSRSGGDDDSSYSIQGQRYGSNGSLVGVEFQVNTYTTGAQDSPAVDLDIAGNFVVVWRSAGSSGDDTSGYSIQGRLYASDGSPVGPDGQVNTQTIGNQSSPSVAVDALGDFAVVWQSSEAASGDTSGYSIQGRLYASNGLPVGPDGQINTYTTSNQGSPVVGIDSDGDFVVVWKSEGSGGTDDSGTSIQGQRFSISLFVDGFESGNTSHWSSSSP